MLKENETIRIEAVENGFLLMKGDRNGGEMPQAMVFQSMFELSMHLMNHFTYRCPELTPDNL